ncbi:MAG: pyridoxamine 5'-phosphate oxidase family protein [Desulfomonilia bacterium]|jgi:predicted pyridoxine 5'-phosphate oxidase superfamily flavin-nucleotide-binding protein
MAKMNEKVRALFESQPIAVLATSSADGTPNAVPIGAKKVLDNETILISDQHFGKTLANLKANPQASLAFWNPETGEAYQIKGTVTIETSGKIFEETAAWIEEIARIRKIPMKSKGAVVLKIDAVFTSSPGPDAGSRID